MPNAHGQVTPEDFKAPAGMFRIMREEISDGQLTIIADFHQRVFAGMALDVFHSAHPGDIFTLCDDRGVVEEIDYDDGDFEDLLKKCPPSTW